MKLRISIRIINRITYSEATFQNTSVSKLLNIGYATKYIKDLLSSADWEINGQLVKT